eukprot:TRINITY_DN46140_c0_g1_i1.p1 TRINITY_DN46140_c0_g1~~TRINITY_DN46140_c0_g1_i1.p1  ORF type:complete len:103 (+),score=3.56 TRINITY_DN46140_c0_g1_i1:410-718(+)
MIFFPNYFFEDCSPATSTLPSPNLVMISIHWVIFSLGAISCPFILKFNFPPNCIFFPYIHHYQSITSNVQLPHFFPLDQMIIFPHFLKEISMDSLQTNCYPC